MKVLVTGADGFVGRWLCAHLQAEGDDVWRAVGRRESAHSDPRAAHVDLLEREEVRGICEWAAPDAIYHLAAVAFGPDAQRDPGAAVAVTVGGTINLLSAASHASPAPTVLIPSSGEVYGVPLTPEPLRETDDVRPTNAYGSTKAAQEQVAMAYHHAGSVQVVISRAFNHIGPGQRSDFVVSSLAQQLRAETAPGESVRLMVGNLDAERDFTDVRDVVAAYRLLVTGQHVGQPFNVASGTAVPIREILRRLVELSGRAVDVQVDPARVRAVDPPTIVGDAGLLRHATGWAPRIPLSETLRDIWEASQVA